MGKTTTKGTRYKCYSVGTLLFKTTVASLTDSAGARLRVAAPIERMQGPTKPNL
jgi:hypothetical protein